MFTKPIILASFSSSSSSLQLTQLVTRAETMVQDSGCTWI
ncbi:hypothetical protein HID58_031348 [Brassica napus]|uniref:Uncharacterized protein n=1 Tax=Brassica napus TaxID=3708 RepID=A0ABQ7XG00_BRANA|nr:hypothetical protein HID58_031348 [Brassica napus]